MYGILTSSNGTFEIQVNQKDFKVEISFIGFANLMIDDFKIENGNVDLGTVTLSEDNETIEEVIVTAEKSKTTFKLDKRVFNVGEDLSSSGANALELLNNVPSVNVDIEGEISLRGSAGVQILINGKPSVLASEEGNALGTITADMIDRIEVITSPSAKYEAEGSSGIINIVIKKEERKGVNGSVSVNTGFPHNHSVGLSVNRRTEKFNLFSQLGVGYREMPRMSENINEDFLTGETIISDGIGYRNETFYNVILGTDYHINKYNVLTLSGNFSYEIEDQPLETFFTEMDGNENNISEWVRTENTAATNPKWQYELQYKKDFKDNKKHALVFGALGSFFGKDQSSEFENTAISGSVDNLLQNTRTDFSEAKYTFQLDYVKPITEAITFETGALYVSQNVSNDYEVSDFKNDLWVIDEGLTNVFDYNQNVFGVYGTGAYEGDRWGVKVGARLENTDLTTLLVNTDETNDQNYTNLFPSIHTSYKISDRMSIQAGYSKRIYRPRLWDLNPFFNISNNFSIRTGNPNLNPEFTDAYEINSIYILDKITLNVGAYYRNSTDVIESISTFEDNVNIYTPENIGTSRTTGLEMNFKYTPQKWISFNGDFNFNYFNRQGEFEDQVFDFNASRWTSKMTSKFKLPASIELELTGNYNSSYQNIQGIIGRNVFADLGARKKIGDGKLVLNMSIRDIFATRNRESEILDEDFYIYNFAQRGRFVTFGLSYAFGKGEAMEYAGQRRRR